MMKAAELRQSILWLAIQGKLISQDDSDEPASVLLRRISDKKAELNPKTRMKKAKTTVAVDFSDVPFDIPDSWEWCHLCDLGNFSSGKTPDMTNPLFWENATIPWITSKDMKKKYLNDSVLKITKLAQQGMVMYPAGTLLMVVRSGILKRMLPICILTMDSTINQDVKAFSLFDRSMSSYVFYMLKGLERHILENYTKQVTTVDSLRFPEFSTEMPVPLPPLAEQQRIAAKLDELMTLCDELEAEEKNLDKLETCLIEYLPKSILWAAVQGKLVPQNIHDEPASELLKQIQKEKDNLVKEGKIKKERPLPSITEGEIPYDLPEGWEWCRLGELVGLLSGRDLEPSAYSDLRAGIPYITGASNLTETGINITRWTQQPSVISITRDILLSCKGTIGKIVFNTIGDCHIARQIMAIRPLFTEVLPEYISIVLSASIDNLTIKARSIIPGIARNDVIYLIFPLPPLAEQQRIVVKVDELMALYNELKSAYTTPVDLPKSKSIIQFSAVEPVEETLLAARGDVGQLSNEAMQAIDDLFAEDEE